MEPLSRASWIWPFGHLYLYNHFAHFRKDFELDSVPDRAPLFITADAAYKLWINGQYVCRGPARGYQKSWPFDEVEVSSFLHTGANWIAVIAYNPGASTFRYIHQDAAGLLCAAHWGDFELRSDESWQMRRSPAHKTDVARLSLQLDFQEHLDIRLGDLNWIFDPVPPVDWKMEPRMFETGLERHPFGRPPWETVEPRGIPLLREAVTSPKTIVGIVDGLSNPRYGDSFNVAWAWDSEARACEWKPAPPLEGRLIDGCFELTLSPTGLGRFHGVCLDMGEMVVGNLIIAAEGAKGGELLDFQHTERWLGTRPQLNPPGTASGIALGNRIRLAKGSTRHEFFHALGFRYVTVVARDVEQPITLRIHVRTAAYPFTMRGEFTCSDATLNAIHTACRHTQQVCSLDAYMDTPWREQAQWWGDARVSGRNTFYLDGDTRLFARGIRSIAKQYAPEGLTYGHAPTYGHNCILPDFSLTWILTLWDYYWQTGDTALIAEQWPRVQEVLAYFDTPLARSAEGLLRHDRRFWLFEDWSELWKGEVPTFLNLWYLLTLRHAAQLSAMIGHDMDARALQEKAAHHADLCVTRLFDAEQGLFREGLDCPDDRCSVQDQTIAIMLGLAPEQHENMIQKRLLPYLRDEPFFGARASAFWCANVLEVMLQLGYAEAALSFIRKHWSPMLETGTTWEEFFWDERGYSASHAWTSHPSYHLVNGLVGLTQTAPAWSKVKFVPGVVDGIDFAQATVPSSQGDIEAGWRRDGTEIEAWITTPPGVVAEVVVPNQPPAFSRGSRSSFRFSAIRNN